RAKLLVQIGRAGRDLIGGRLAVLRRSAFNDITDVDVIALQPHALLDHVGQELPGPADKGQPGAVFLGPRRLADKDDASDRRPLAEDRLRASMRQPALRAGFDLRRVELLQDRESFGPRFRIVGRADANRAGLSGSGLAPGSSFRPLIPPDWQHPRPEN